MSVSVIEVMSGCKIAELSSDRVMLGCPSEILKVLARKNLEMPKTIISPSVFYRFGINQAALEFPLDNFLFNQHRFAEGKKLKVCGTEKQNIRMRNILRHTLLGPTEKEMRLWKIPEEEIKRHKKISDDFALKNPDGSIASINDMVEFIDFDARGVAELGNGAQIQNIDENVFKIIDGTKEFFVDISLQEKQKPPLPITVSNSLPNRSVLGLTALSKCVSGFDPAGYTSGLILWLNGLAVALDGVTWLKEHLRAFGINPDEIQAYILSHPYDDHSNILDMVVNGKMMNLITAKTIYGSFMVKVLNILEEEPFPNKEMNVFEKMPEPWEKIRKLINFTEIVPGEKFHWYGAEFDFWETVHPIPTIGFKVSVNNKSIVYSGDTLWGERLKDLKSRDIITCEQYTKISYLPYLESDLTVFDGGGGLIHALPEELANLPDDIREDRMILTHTSILPEAVKNKLGLIEAGKHYEIIAQSDWSLNDILAINSSPLIKEVDDNWQSVIFSQAGILYYSPGRIIVQEGQPNENFYILLRGTISVLYGDEEVAELSTGDFFGEISLMRDISCTATIKAKTPVSILELPKEIFLELIKSTDLYEKLIKIYQVRPALMKFPLFKNLSAENMNRVIEKTVVFESPAGTRIISQGDIGDHFYGLIDGKAKVVKDGKEIAILYPGQFFGEMALLGDWVRSADVIAIAPLMVFSLNKSDFDLLVAQIPTLSYELELLAARRKKENKSNQKD